MDENVCQLKLIEIRVSQSELVSNSPCSLTRNNPSHSMKRLFIAYSDERLLYYQFSLPKLTHLSLKVVLHWSICNANLGTMFDVAWKIVQVEPRCGRFFALFAVLQRVESDSQTCSKCNMFANSCENHALRIGVASWRCKLTSVTPP